MAGSHIRRTDEDWMDGVCLGFFEALAYGAGDSRR
jgi:hypothetical protein